MKSRFTQSLGFSYLRITKYGFSNRQIIKRIDRLSVLCREGPREGAKKLRNINHPTILGNSFDVDNRMWICAEKFSTGVVNKIQAIWWEGSLVQERESAIPWRIRIHIYMIQWNITEIIISSKFSKLFTKIWLHFIMCTSPNGITSFLFWVIFSCYHNHLNYSASMREIFYVWKGIFVDAEYQKSFFWGI